MDSLKTLWQENRGDIWSFYCPQCKIPRRVPYRPRPGLKHYAADRADGSRPHASHLELVFVERHRRLHSDLDVFEAIYRAKVRAALSCENCGFDPILYLVDTKRARREIENHGRKNLKKKGFPIPLFRMAKRQASAFLSPSLLRRIRPASKKSCPTTEAVQQHNIDLSPHRASSGGMSVNKVILVGRLGQNPEVRYTPSGAAVANFSVATNESWTDKSGQKQERTEWHRVVVWGKLAELCSQYLSKGRQCYVEGRLQTRQWQDKDGQTKYTTEVQAQTIQFLGGMPVPARERVRRTMPATARQRSASAGFGGGAQVAPAMATTLRVTGRHSI